MVLASFVINTHLWKKILEKTNFKGQKFWTENVSDKYFVRNFFTSKIFSVRIFFPLNADWLIFYFLWNEIVYAETKLSEIFSVQIFPKICLLWNGWIWKAVIWVFLRVNDRSEDNFSSWGILMSYFGSSLLRNWWGKFSVHMRRNKKCRCHYKSPLWVKVWAVAPTCYLINFLSPPSYFQLFCNIKINQDVCQLYSENIRMKLLYICDIISLTKRGYPCETISSENWTI